MKSKTNVARLSAAAIAGLLVCSAADAEIANNRIRIGVLSDLAGIYEQNAGNGSVEAARIAVEEFGGKINGATVEVVAGDHQNKPDVGATLANRWFDVDGVDMITDLVNSAVGFAVVDVAKAKNKTVILTSAGSADFTGKACAPDNSIHWIYDTYQMGKSMGEAVPQLGKTWFFITADYAFGHDLEKQASDEVIAQGGKVLGSVRHPINTSDFASFLLQAQSSGAQVIALANAGGDTVNAIKQAAEFGIGQKQKIAALIFDLQSVTSLGLNSAQGLTALNAFYWDQDDGTRAWSQKYQAQHPKKMMPNHMQAGVYSATMHYLQAVEKSGSPADGQAVVAAMKRIPINDPLTGKGAIREDGRAIHPMLLLQVKTSAESKSEWDVFKIVGTIRAEMAFRPLADGRCPLVAKKD